MAATKFAELVESRTNGAYKIEIYPNGSLGDEPAMLESMQIGTLDAADISGLKIRVMENEVYTATFKALGVNAVPMAWSEALTALQQGTIEGQENPVNVLHSYKLWETQQYCTLTRHAYASAIITMSLDVFNGLPADVQDIFKAAAQEAAEYERQWVADNEATQLQALKDGGMEIIEEPDMASFQSAVQSVYDSYPQYADNLARIRAELG